jgi:hypothetical protein
MLAKETHRVRKAKQRWNLEFAVGLARERQTRAQKSHKYHQPFTLSVMKGATKSF